MSYSFNVQAPTKAETEIKVRDKLVEVVEAQPIHKRDCDQAYNTAEAFIRQLTDDPTKDVHVSVNGSLSWTEGEVITWANISVTAHVVGRKNT